MREGITVEVSAADRARLEAIVNDRNSAQKHVWRAPVLPLNQHVRRALARTSAKTDPRKSSLLEH